MEFKDYIKKGEVKIREKNYILAKALIKSSEKNFNFSKRLNLDDENAEYIVEKAYDSIRELIEAKLSIEGYKSYSHEATILYLKNFDIFTEQEINFLDDLRKLRNGIKYYGKESNIEEAKKTLEFMDRIIIKLKKILESRNQ